LKKEKRKIREKEQRNKRKKVIIKKLLFAEVILA
jgi:hypothetical protein